MIWKDGDQEVYKNAVSADYCKSDDWQKVKYIFDDRFKC